MAPIIAALVSHGLGLVANAALAKGKDFIKEKTGVDLDKAALSQEDLVVLKKYELEDEEELLRLRLADDRLSLEEQKIRFQDVSGAREREVAIASIDTTSWLLKNTPSLLALSTVFLTFVFFGVFAWFGKDANPENQVAKEIMLYVLGVLSAVLTQIFGYYFGSSRGSAEKSRTIDSLVEKETER
jgi:hypothetical protein